ncbi:hypothetical protein OUZ56_030370 [Daphnia magna]|uniref:Uncharacterized protein n=1 Tax=Daphnia magna TaxID=35525 RepID=A0ABQ9ZR34_9CRUS|nr:hypothetical protein OUZ56_030370 [Daphnia magna]
MSARDAHDVFKKRLWGSSRDRRIFPLVLDWMIIIRKPSFQKKKRFSSISCSIFSMIRSLECVLNSVDAASYDPKVVHSRLHLPRKMDIPVRPVGFSCQLAASRRSTAAKLNNDNKTIIIIKSD